ncbi:MAG TPA: MarR family transcriptional regulator [Thermoplasmata archaeon]|nr:MarR family transcriptional regulator [Thermoplasmata archaeon]
MPQTLLAERSTPRPARRHAVASDTPFENLAVNLRVLRRLVAEQLAEDELAVTDFWALTGVGDGVTSPTALGRLLAVSPAGMTQLLDRLEGRGLIGRAPSPDDRRATVLALTAKGRDLQRRAGTRCTRFLDAVASELSPDGLVGLQVLSRELGVILARRRAAHPPPE